MIEGKTVNRETKGKDSNVSKRLSNVEATLWGASKIQSKFDQALSISKQYTSITFMALNVTGGIKNIMSGYMNIMQEAFAKEFIGHSDIKFGISHYNVTDIIAGIGNEYSDNINVAIMKRFANMMELKNEKGYESDVSLNSDHKVKMAFDSLYFLNNITEHFMQYTTLLASMNSHKVVGNTFMNFDEFYNDKRKQIIESIINEDQKIV